MSFHTSSRFPCLALAFYALACLPAVGETENLGNGFFHHGVATPVSNHRGTVATVDANGDNVVLVWLFDHRGGYALLMIDADTGASEEFPTPFPPGGDCPYASILSTGNKYYTHFNSHFCEFDPEKRAFTFFSKTARQMAMGMTEDDDGVIWSVTYPNSGVVSFDPETREFKDYGHVHDENWAQYQRYVAADDAGWIYFGIGSTASQIISFDPESGQAKPIVAESDRVRGTGAVYRDVNGKVYGHTGSGKPADWYELYRGESIRLDAPPSVNHKPIITGSQGLFHTDFPDGERLQTCDLVDRILVVEDPKSGETRKLTFEYTSEGAHIMSIATAPDGTICGGTAFPMRFFSYDAAKDVWINRASYGQWNTVVRQGDRFFVGGYGGGFLLEWDPSRDWVATQKGAPENNPVFHVECTPTIHRPHDLLAHPDGKTIVLAGTPGYGATGGGLLFWDRETQSATVIEHTDILPEHATHSLVALDNNRILGGTTTRPGTGGETKAKEAELYIMNMATKAVEWHAVMFPGVTGFTDLYRATNGLVYGVTDRTRFFVFDPEARRIVHALNLTDDFGSTNSQQGPRVFIPTPDGALYMLFVKGIGRVDLETHAITFLADSPVSIGPGGDYLDGRIYFGSGSHLYSYEIGSVDR